MNTKLLKNSKHLDIMMERRQKAKNKMMMEEVENIDDGRNKKLSDF